MINVYCDESCHLEHDNSNIMVIGGVWCSKDKVKLISDKIKALKAEHGIKSNTEIKWVKVSRNKGDFYKKLVELFFEEDINFRCIVVTDKSKLRHNDYNQDHNIYYQMNIHHKVFHMLHPLKP